MTMIVVRCRVGFHASAWSNDTSQTNGRIAANNDGLEKDGAPVESERAHRGFGVQSNIIFELNEIVLSNICPCIDNDSFADLGTH